MKLAAVAVSAVLALSPVSLGNSSFVVDDGAVFAGVAPHKVVARKVLNPADARQYAAARTSTRQFRCLDLLWTRESNWRHNAYNHTPVYQTINGKRVARHAYGIPQILDLPRHLSTAQQIDKGLAYIVARYGSPCKAWAFSQAHGWY